MASPILPYSTHTSPAATAITTLTTLGPNGAFGGNVNAAGYNLGTLGGLTIGYKTTKEICLGIRTSGKAGSGSWDDPFNVSSKALFDAKWAAILAAPAANYIIRLRDGSFPFGGCLVHGTENMIAGMQIYGEGPGKTIIQGMGESHIFFGLGGNHHIEGISFDCGYTRIGNPTGRYSAFNIGGANCKIRNCEAYGGGSDVDECFIMFIIGGDGNGAPGFDSDIPDNAVIEDCYLHDCSNNASYLGIINFNAQTASSPKEYATGGVVRNNVLVGDYPAYNTQGLGLGGFDGGQVYGNTVTDMNHAYFDDTLWNKNQQIHDNYLHSTGNGILINTPTQEQVNPHIYDNVIISNSCIGLIGATPGIIQKAYIHDNRCIDLAGGSGNHSVFLRGTAGAVVLNNVIDAALTNYEDDGGDVAACSGTYYRGNVTPTGVVSIADTMGSIQGTSLTITHDNDNLEPIITAQANNETVATALTYQGLNVRGTASNLDIYLEAKGTGVLRFRATGAGSDNVKLDSNGDYYRVATKLLGARKTGWAVDTGTAKRTANATYSGTAEVAYTQATIQALMDAVRDQSQALKALKDDLHATAGHGLIGT